MFDLYSAVVIYYKSTHSDMLSLQLDIPLTLVFGDTKKGSSSYSQGIIHNID